MKEALDCYDKYFAAAIEGLIAVHSSAQYNEDRVKEADEIAHMMVVQRYKRIHDCAKNGGQLDGVSYL